LAQALLEVEVGAAVVRYFSDLMPQHT